MNIKLGSSEDFTINTKSNYVLTFPNATGTIALTSDLTSKESSSNKVTAWSSTTTDAHYPSEKLVKTSLDGKLDKTTWEWNKQLSNGSNGKVCIGKFFMYDSNVTIDLSFTSTNTYNATVVLTSANLNRAASPGRIQVDVYGDIPNTITPLLSVFRPNEYSTGSVEVYADLPAWSKCFVHIQGILDGANNATEGGNSYPESAYDILTSVTSIPTAITGKTLLTNDGTSQNGRVCNLMKKDYYSKVANGTSSQFLKADGSVDSNAYTTHGIPTGGSDGQMLVKSSATNYAVEWSSPVKEVTWSTLKTLRDSSKLIPGQQYRITDYVATTTQTDTQSANHPFDVIVTATSTNTLSCEAKAVQHVGDTYFNTSKLDRWKIWYTLDNSGFGWADSTNGKGIIYRMIDEYGNDMPYDFKGIQFKRYEISSVSYSNLAPLVGLPIGASYHRGISINTSKYKWYYTLSRISDDISVTSWDTEVTDASICAAMAANVKFTMGSKSNPNDSLDPLLDNVFLYGSVVFNFWKDHSNATDSYTVGATFPTDFEFDGPDCTRNTIIGWSGIVKTKGTFRRNLIVSSFRHCNIGSNCQDNTIFTKSFTSLEIGHAFSENVFGGDTNGKAGIVQNSIIENYIYQNTVTIGNSDSITNCRFGNLFGRNTLENVYLGTVSTEGQVLDSYFTGKFLGMTINGICGYMRVYGGTNGNTAVGLDLVGGIRGTSSAYAYIQSSEWIYASAAGMIPRRRIEADSNGNLVMSYWSNGKHVVKTKGLAGSTWTILPSYEDYDDGQNIANQTLYNSSYYFMIDPSKRLNIFRLSSTNLGSIGLRFPESATAGDFHREYHVLFQVDGSNAYSDTLRLNGAWNNTVMSQARDTTYINGEYAFEGNGSGKYYELDLHSAGGDCYAELNILCEQTSTVKSGYTGAYRNWYVRTDGIYGSVEEEMM